MLGHRRSAAALLRCTRRLRNADGSYWTGYQYENDVLWPTELTTWTAGSILLGNAALNADPATTGVFGRSQ